MAIIKCPGCNKEVSSWVGRCPYCNKRISFIKILINVFAGVIALCVIWAVYAVIFNYIGIIDIGPVNATIGTSSVYECSDNDAKKVTVDIVKDNLAKILNEKDLSETSVRLNKIKTKHRDRQSGSCECKAKISVKVNSKPGDKRFETDIEYTTFKTSEGIRVEIDKLNLSKFSKRYY
jgi:hypothetical protein